VFVALNLLTEVSHCFVSAVVSAASPSPLSRKMIPAECCSLPFTLNGQLYHSCAQNASNPTDIGCLIGNRTWVSCLLPASEINVNRIYILIKLLITDIFRFWAVVQWRQHIQHLR